MEFSAPIYQLKRHAKRLSRQKGIPLTKALDGLAIQEGFQSWSHLAATWSKTGPAATILHQLGAGEMVLIGARPGQGKTLLGLEIASKAAEVGRRGMFFTLDYHEQDVAGRLAMLGVEQRSATDPVTIDTSDEICADYILSRVAGDPGPVIAVIDFLQLLDQRRNTPPLEEQVQSLKAGMKATGGICVAISQIDRAFEISGKSMPDITDIRLPNPLDTAVFDRAYFLNEGKVRLDRAA